MEYGNCAAQSTNKIIVAEEHTRRLAIHNPSGKTVRKIKIDKCLFHDSDPCKRCDYMFEIFDQDDINKISLVIYLELKGRHIEEAYSQLVATLDFFSSIHQQIAKECHIVASRVPKAGPSTQQLTVKLRKEKAARLVVNTTQARITI